MPKPYSIDLRHRVVEYLKKTQDKKKASELFQVGIATVYRWAARLAQKGHVEPLRRERAYKKINDEQLTAYVKEHPDHFLSEIAAHFGLTLQAIFYALKRLKITRKKRPRYTKKETKRLEQNL